MRYVIMAVVALVAFLVLGGLVVHVLLYGGLVAAGFLAGVGYGRVSAALEYRRQKRLSS